ncbi:MAG: helix-turn-helix domain-containing protein [Oscillospiraceae bacterium]|jgi:transcriptional regulator with XRE-family HTH domain
MKKSRKMSIIEGNSNVTRQDIVRNFTLNIEKERINLGLTQAQMAEKLQLSLSGYKKMISGETSRIDLYTAHLMYKLTGKLIFELLNDWGEELEIMRQFYRLTPSQYHFVKSIIDFETAFLGENENPDDYISVLVLTGNMEDGMIYDSSNIIKVNAAPYRKRFGSDLHCGIKITSNHLHPVYHLGDILLICRKPIRDGDTGIFINKETGRVYVRKFHQTDPCVLEPINGYGEAFTVNSYDEEDMNKWIKFGYVLTKMRE